MKNFVVFISLLLTVLSFGQTASEKQILDYINHVRTSPKSFLNEVAIPYIEENNLSRNSYAKSLIRDLKKIDSKDSLHFDSSLQKMAKDFAQEAGRKGWTGHVRVDKRFEKYAEHVDITAENLQFGYNEARDIVMDLLIDIDIPNLGHRKNILDSDFSIVGIATDTHRDYDYITVMNFGGFEK